MFLYKFALSYSHLCGFNSITTTYFSPKYHEKLVQVLVFQAFSRCILVNNRSLGWRQSLRSFCISLVCLLLSGQMGTSKSSFLSSTKSSFSFLLSSIRERWKKRLMRRVALEEREREREPHKETKERSLVGLAAGILRCPQKWQVWHSRWHPNLWDLFTILN